MTKSPWRPLDPRALILFCLSFSLCTAFLTSLSASLLALAIAIAFFLLSHASFLWRRLAAANIFILFIWLVVPWTTPGETVFQLGVLKFSATGLRLCLLTTIKANALVIIFLSLVTPMPLSTLDNALQRLHCPQKLLWLFLLMGRNIHLLKTVWTSLGNAAKLRSFRPQTSLHTYRTLAALLAILLLRAHERSLRIHEAMLLRGFSGKLPIGPALRYGASDCLFFVFLLFLLSAMLSLEFLDV